MYRKAGMENLTDISKPHASNIHLSENDGVNDLEHPCWVKHQSNDLEHPC